MELDRDKNLDTTRTDGLVGTERMDREVGMNTGGTTGPTQTTSHYDRDSGRSNFLAYLIGGLVIAVGLMAFLFYDGGNQDVSTTGSTRPSVQTPASPSAPGMGGATNQSAPTTPSAPAR
jgi:hypothetical protein